MSSAKDLRTQAIAQRKALTSQQIQDLSAKVAHRFLSGCGLGPEDWKGKRVALYRALQGELDLVVLQSRLQEYGAQICFPRILDLKARKMEFAMAPVPESAGGDPSMEEVWPQGPYGILEPPSHFKIVTPAELDVIFVPGAVFGMGGERVGMGGGFYDRYLPSAPQALRVVLAFDFQLLPKVEQESWDQQMHWIWTENRQVRLRSWPG